MDSINLQLGSGLLLLLIGSVLGGYIDFYRVFRSKIKLNKFIDFVCDLFFWIIAAILFIPLIYWVNWLELRLYVWVALLVGLSLYYMCFSQFMIPLFNNLWKVITWLPRQLTNIIKRYQLFISKVVYRIKFKTNQVKNQKK